VGETKIEWADFTFSPWRGCTKVSPGCLHCYSEALSKRNPAVLGEWGPSGTRVGAAESYWKLPVRWNTRARAELPRDHAFRVFCLSLGDICEDHPALPPLRRRLGELICKTPFLDYMLLTKRPENWDMARYEMFGPGMLVPPHNAWLGVSAENQETANRRVPLLLQAKLDPHAVRFVSYEPALEEVDFGPFLRTRGIPGHCFDADGAEWHEPGRCRGAVVNCDGRCCGPRLDLVIIGGESGPHARPFRLTWARNVIRQCAAAKVLAFMKQTGSRPFDYHLDMASEYGGTELSGFYPLPKPVDPKGGDPPEWPLDIRVRQMPSRSLYRRDEATGGYALTWEDVP